MNECLSIPERVILYKKSVNTKLGNEKKKNVIGAILHPKRTKDKVCRKRQRNGLLKRCYMGSKLAMGQMPIKPTKPTKAALGWARYLNLSPYNFNPNSCDHAIPSSTAGRVILACARLTLAARWGNRPGLCPILKGNWIRDLRMPQISAVPLTKIHSGLGFRQLPLSTDTYYIAG